MRPWKTEAKVEAKASCYEARYYEAKAEARESHVA